MFDLTVIDSAIIIILLFGALIGFKRGIIKSAISFIGLIIVLVLAFTLKNSLSEFMYTHLPFFNIGGDFAGVTILNILIYETIAFLILAILFGVVLRLIVAFTGIIEKILDLTIILGFFSKLFGLIFGFVETYIILFVIIYASYNFTNLSNYIDEGVLTSRMLNSTPILSSTVANESKSIKEINALQNTCKANNHECNIDALDIMLKYNVLKPETAEKLINSGKININGAMEIVNKYKGENNNA
jgi:uncharacterized membrane protein required for colicin V production